VNEEAYRHVEKLVSGIRNAKYDDMVRHLASAFRLDNPEARAAHAKSAFDLQCR
jgi:hypothetical protein